MPLVLITNISVVAHFQHFLCTVYSTWSGAINPSVCGLLYDRGNRRGKHENIPTHMRKNPKSWTADGRHTGNAGEIENKTSSGYRRTRLVCPVQSHPWSVHFFRSFGLVRTCSSGKYHPPYRYLRLTRSCHRRIITVTLKSHSVLGKCCPEGKHLEIITAFWSTLYSSANRVVRPLIFLMAIGRRGDGREKTRNISYTKHHSWFLAEVFWALLNVLCWVLSNAQVHDKLLDFSQLELSLYLSRKPTLDAIKRRILQTTEVL